MAMQLDQMGYGSLEYGGANIILLHLLRSTVAFDTVSGSSSSSQPELSRYTRYWYMANDVI